MTVELPARADGIARLTSTSRRDVWLEISSDDVMRASTAESTGDALVFSAVRPATDVVQLAGGDRFEELRVVHEAADVVEGRWRIRLGPALADLVVVDGQIRARSSDGYAWFQSYPLWVVDAAGTRRTAAAHATSHGSEATLTVRAETTGMVAPIALDPSFTSGGVLPGIIYEGLYGASVVPMASGKVLLVTKPTGTGTPEAYLYDSTTNTGVRPPGFSSTWASHERFSAAALGDGRAVFPSFVYDGVAATAFTPPIGFDYANSRPLAVSLPSGEVLVTGLGSARNGTEIISGSPLTVKRVADAPFPMIGQEKGLSIGGKIAICQAGTMGVYDPATDTWTNTLHPTDYYGGRMGFAALPGERLLVAGGSAYTSKAYRYNMAAKSWTALPNMGTPRRNFDAFGLNNGALVVAGYSEGTYALSTSEFFDATSGTWSPGPSLAARRMSYLGGPIGGGKFIVAGGFDGVSYYSSVEILNALVAGGSCTSSTSCDSGLACVDGVCCTTSSCPSGTKCSAALGGKCTKLAGQPCGSAAECASGSCSDGVCCDTACTSACEACTAAKKGSGSDGTCGPIAADTDPDGDCPTDSGYPSSCKSDGACDGTGKCRAFAKLGTACGTTTCAAGVINGNICDGSGACNMASTACAPYACGADACKTSCTTDVDCASGAFCSGGVCVTGKANGQPCGSAKECGSGLCADGVCCNVACTGQCEACAEPTNKGTCITVSGTPRGSRPKCAGTPDVCGGTCNGTKAAECSFPSTSTVCARTCAEGEVSESSCDGLGACIKGASKTCAPYACADATRCRTECAMDSECAESHACVSNLCVPRGARCSEDLSQSIGADGTAASCAPYMCDPSIGVCRSLCMSKSDCANDYVCAGSTCQPAPQADDGGCALGRRGSSLAAPFGVMLLLGLFRRAFQRG